MARTFRRPTTLGVFEARLGSRTIRYTLKRSYRARSIRLDVRADRGLTITVPRGYRTEDLPSLLQEKAPWLLSALVKVASRPRPAPPQNLANGDFVPLLGKPVEIVLFEKVAKHTTVGLMDGRLTVHRGSPGHRLPLVLEAWYRVQARKVIEEKAAELSRQMGVKSGRVRIGGARTRWGSCSKQGNLNFCWRLVMAPSPVIDYVIIHELAHLKEMNHSRQFWEVVGEWCPEWRAHRKWLKDHDADLVSWKIPDRT